MKGEFIKETKYQDMFIGHSLGLVTGIIFDSIRNTFRYVKYLVK